MWSAAITQKPRSRKKSVWLMKVYLNLPNIWFDPSLSTEKLLACKKIDKITEKWFLVCLDSIIRKPGDMRQMAFLQRLGGSVLLALSFFIADNDMNHSLWWSLRNSIAIISRKLISLKKVIAGNPASKPDSGPFYWYFKVIKIKQVKELFPVLVYTGQHSTFERLWSKFSCP